MITRDQALNLSTFHIPRLGPQVTRCDVWRRNGRTQTWVRRPDDFRVPVKYGMYEYGQILHTDASRFYAPTDCPACHGSKS